MRRLLFSLVVLLFLAGAAIYAQDTPEPEPPAEPQAPDSPETPEEPGKENVDPDEGKIIVYLDVRDYVDDTPYKWRVVQYLIQQTFELANPEKEEKFKDDWRKRYDWSKFSENEREKKLNEDYKKLVKEKGVQNMKLTDIKVVIYREKPKPKKEKKEEGEEGEEDGEAEKDENGGEEQGEEPADEPGEGEKEEPAKPAKPEKEWVDPKDTADYWIVGEARFKSGKTTKYFGESVEWQSIGEYDIKLIRRIDQKVIKEFKKKDFKQGDTRGQEVAHNRCMRTLGQELATEVVKLPDWRKKK